MTVLFEMRSSISKSNAFFVAEERIKDLLNECAYMARCNGMFKRTLETVHEYVNKLEASLPSVKDPKRITDAEFKAIEDAYNYPILN